MKKTFLTLVAIGFGMSVALAQTTETEVEAPQQDVQLEQTESPEAMAQDEQTRTEVEMAELPVAVQDAFKNGQYSNWEVLAIYQVEAEAGEATEATEGLVYEFELAQNSEEAVNTEIEGVEVEEVSNRQPDLILQIDESGQVIEEKSTDEME